MAVPSISRKTEVVAVQHVMEESEKPLAPDGVEIRHLLQKISIPGRPYSESLTAQINAVSLSPAKFLLSGAVLLAINADQPMCCEYRKY